MGGMCREGGGRAIRRGGVETKYASLPRATQFGDSPHNQVLTILFAGLLADSNWLSAIFINLGTNISFQLIDIDARCTNIRFKCALLCLFDWSFFSENICKLVI